MATTLQEGATDGGRAGFGGDGFVVLSDVFVFLDAAVVFAFPEAARRIAPPVRRNPLSWIHRFLSWSLVRPGRLVASLAHLFPALSPSA